MQYKIKRQNVRIDNQFLGGEPFRNKAGEYLMETSSQP